MARQKQISIVKVHPSLMRKHKPRKMPPRPTQVGRHLAAGFKEQPGLDLKRFKGKVVPALSYLNIYLDSGRWKPSDMKSIDDALSGAMSDSALNNVLKQYFDGAVSTTFLGRKQSNAAVPATFTRDDVSDTLGSLLDEGQLEGVDFSKTVVCLLLPPGVILDTFSSDGVGTEDKGLGGDKYVAEATLSLHGVSKTVELPFTVDFSGDEARMKGEVVLQRDVFGVGQGDYAASVPIDVTVEVTVAAHRAK